MHVHVAAVASTLNTHISRVPVQRRVVGVERGLFHAHVGQEDVARSDQPVLIIQPNGVGVIGSHGARQEQEQSGPQPEISSKHVFVTGRCYVRGYQTCFHSMYLS
jgi:hypothetical protein